MVFGLGVRHGFDLDHLATIDTITRAFNREDRLARWGGVLFSFGHGLVVIVISFIMGTGFMELNAPWWLESFGNWISIFFLILFGLITLWSEFSHTKVLPAGFKSLLVLKFIKKKLNPLLIMGIGALFALSFDTFTQVALFSLSASMMASGYICFIFGAIFMLGMMAADGLNGLAIFSLLQLSDKNSAFISRVLGFCIASFSLTLGLFGLIRQLTI